MKKYLIIGSSSFIAKNLINKLYNNAQNITLITRKKKTINNLFKLKQVVCSIANYKKILRYTDSKTYIFLFSNSIKPSSNNINNFNNLIKIISDYYTLLINLNNNNCKKIFFISSAGSLLNNIPKSKFNEFSINPSNFYGLSKFNIEQMIKYISINNKLNYSIIRLYNIYGKPLYKRSTIYGLINKSIKNHFNKITTKITVNPKKTKINFTLIDDAINFIIRNLDTNKKIILCKKSSNLSIHKLILILKKISNNKISFKFDKKSKIFKTMINHNSKINIKRNIQNIYLNY